MVATLKIVIGVVIVAVCVTALVVGIVLGTRNYDSCDTAAAPTDLLFEQNSDYSVAVSWQDKERSEDCEVTYLVGYDLDGEAPEGNQLNTTLLKRTIPAMQACTVLGVHIYAIGDSGELSEDHLMGNYTVKPNQAALTATDMEFSVADDNLIMKWDVPESLSKCESSLTYEISVETDKEDIETETITDTTHSIGYDSFCLKANISITTIYDTITGDPVEWSFSDSSDVLNLQILERVEGSTDLTAKWDDHPKAVECFLSYTAFLRVGDDDRSIDVEDDVFEVNFPFEMCEAASFVIVINQEDGTTEEVIKDATQYPTSNEIAVSGLSIETESGMVLSWDENIIGQCVIIYEIVFETDVEIAVTEYSTNDLTFEVPDNIYCYNLGAKVYGVINADSEDRIVGEADELESKGYAISSVEDLVVTVASDGLSIEWTEHSKANLCSLEYRVEYSYVDDEGNVISDALDTAEPEFDLGIPVEVCVEIDVSVTPFNKDTDWVANPVIKTVTLWPETVGSVSDISVVPGTAEITWTAPPSAGRCGDYQYRLDFISDDGSTYTYPANTNSFIIPNDVTYCFSLTITITPILGTTEGTPSEYIYENNVMSAVSDLEAAVTATEELEVKWTRHPKEDSCLLQYRVTYTLTGEVPQSVVIDSNSKSFPYVYCTDATLSVEVIDANENVGEANPININEGPPASYVADSTVTVAKVGTDNTAGEVSWTDITIGACSVRFDVTVITADEDDYTDVTSPHPFSIKNYCFTLQATVTPVVNGIPLTPIESNIETFVMSAVSDLEYAVTATEELEVKWTRHPKEDSCLLQYRVTYTLIGEDPQSDVIDSNSESFPYVYCTDATLSVQVIDANDNLGEVNDIDINAGPTDISQTIGSVTLALIDSVPTAEWSEVEIGKCDVKYTIEITSEPLMPFYPDVTSPYKLNTNDYCYSVRVGVAPGVGDVIGSYTYQVGSLSIDLEEPQGLKLEVTDAETLTATWTPHDKVNLCGISYDISYSYGTTGEVSYPISDYSATLPLAYCITATVTLTATSNGATSTSTETHVGDYPTSVGPVSNIETVVDEDTGTLQVSWDAPDHVSECTDIEYTVTANRADGEEQDVIQCFIRKPCRITLADYCSAIIFVQATSISGVEETHTHQCPSLFKL